MRANDMPLKHQWSHPSLLPDSGTGTAFCIRCQAGWGTCPDHALHRGKPHFNQTETVSFLCERTKAVIDRLPGRLLLGTIALKLGQYRTQWVEHFYYLNLDALTLGCLLPTKTTVLQLWRAAVLSGFANELTLKDLNEEGGEDVLENEPLRVEDNALDGEGEEDPAATERKWRKDEHARKKKFYEASIANPTRGKQMLTHGTWQSIHPLRNSTSYKGKIGLFFFDPMYAKAEQPTPDDFAKIRDMLQSMAVPGAIAVVFNSFLNFDLWKRNLEETPIDRTHAPWVADPVPLVIVRAEQRNRIPKPGSIIKNFCEYAIILRQSIKDPSRGTRWVRPDGGSLLEQFARSVPEIQPPNSNVWQNYVTPGVAESLHDDDGNRVRMLAEKSVALMWTLINRFLLLGSEDGIFDFFAGTGVLGVAAKMCQVPYFGMEKDGKVAALAQMRLGAISKILDTPEMRASCGKAEGGLMTHRVTIPNCNLKRTYSAFPCRFRHQARMR